MFKLKKIFAVITTSILAVSLSACSAAKDTAAKSNQTLNIGAIGSVDVMPIVIAKEKGFFKKNGIDVHFQPFKSAADRDAAFQAGSLDGIICDEVAICLYQNADFDVKITGVTDGDFMLIANPKTNIHTLQDLKGKSIAISQKTAIEYTLDMILGKNSLDPKTVKKSIVPAVPTRLEMLRNNKVDAALLPEPFSTLALKDGGILLGSASKLGTYPSITAFTKKAIDAKGTDIKAFYKAYNEAVDYINKTPVSEYEDIIIKTVGYPEDMKGKISLPKFRKNTLPSEADIQSAIDWTTKYGMLNKTLNSKDLLSSIGVE